MVFFPVTDIPFMSLVGVGAASFWRGAWYAMDAALFPDDPKASCMSSLVAGFGGFALCHTHLPRLANSSMYMRGLGVYGAALANVFAWRGTWMAWDLATGTAAETASAPPTPEEQAARRHLLASAAASHFSGAAILVGVGHLSSAHAPPARIAINSDRMRWNSKPANSYLEDMAVFVNKPF